MSDDHTPTRDEITTLADLDQAPPEPNQARPAHGAELERDAMTLGFPKSPWELTPHEQMYARGYICTRVPGGWIYEVMTDDSHQPAAAVFVPWIPRQQDAMAGW